MDRRQPASVICQGGLRSSKNWLKLSRDFPGSASNLINYEIAIDDGYRRIDGFLPWDDDYEFVDNTNCEGRILGGAIYNSVSTSTSEILVARKLKPFTFTATASQTAFTGTDDNGRTLSIGNDDANVVVTQNGNTLTLTTDYTISGGNTVTLTSGATLNDTIVIEQNEYAWYKYDSSSGWVQQSTSLTHKYVDGSNTVFKIRSVQQKSGSLNRLFLVDGTNPCLVYNGTTWLFMDSGGADTIGDPGGAQIIDAPSVIEEFQSSIFLGRMLGANEHIVAYSSPNAFYDWDAANGAGQISLPFDLMNMKKYRNTMYVLGRTNINEVVPDTSNGFVTDEITEDIGLISVDAVFELGGTIYFLSPDGFRPIEATDRIGDVNIETISEQIQKFISDLEDDLISEDLDTMVIRKKLQFRMFYTGSESNTSVSKGLIGGYRVTDEGRAWEFGELLGIQTSCVITGVYNNSVVHLHGDHSGGVYQQENFAESFNGDSILSVYATPYLDWGDPTAQKTNRNVQLFLLPEGTLEMFVGVNYDWGDSRHENPMDYLNNVAGVPSQYDFDGAEYDGLDIVYDGGEKPWFRLDTEGDYLSVRFTFVTNGTAKPHTVQALLHEFTPQGSRARN